MAIHQNSLANLKPNRSGSKPKYGELKKKRQISVTDPGWKEAKAVVKQQYGLSISEAIELIGRGKYALIEIDSPS